MRRITRNLLEAFIASALATISYPALAIAQSSEATLEGYVFDAKTLRPLPNAVIQINFSIGATGSGITTTSDANGYYQIPLTTSPVYDSSSLIAFCSTKRGTASVATHFYDQIKAGIYERNFYLTLPRNQTHCVL
jgi:hypothetical protein